MKYSINSTVKVKTRDMEYSGLILPSSDANTLYLKLENGYNIGISLRKIVSIKEIKKADNLDLKSSLVKQNSQLPKISVITTGGTISSKIDYRTGGVAPLTEPQELLSKIPELTKRVNIAKLVSPISIFSEDISYAEWQKLADFVANELNEGLSGVIIAHGTDTLHYTAAALSFMLENLSKPVALVGSQRSSDRGSFDGAENMICAAEFAKSDIAEVAVVMHSSSSDNSCFAIRGTKARKMHTSRRDAFRPINDTPLCEIPVSGKIKIISPYSKRTKNKVTADTRFEPKIALIKVYPGISADVLNYYVDKGYRGIILEGTGLGHVPLRLFSKEKEWLGALKRAKMHSVFIGMTSQCLYGRVDSYVYETGRELEKVGVTYLGDMLSEVAFVKLGCMLGRTKTLIKVKELMVENLKGELNSRLTSNQYLY